MSHTIDDPRVAAAQCLFSLYANAVIAGSSFMGVVWLPGWLQSTVFWEGH